MHRLGDVFDLLLAKISEVDGQFGADLVTHCARDADAAWFSEPFEPRRNVDAVAEQIAILDNYIADMYADAETHLLFLGKHPLHRDRALHGVDGTGEIGDDAVA